MSKTTDRQIVNGETYLIMDAEAREAISEEVTARETAVAEEATARSAAIDEAIAAEAAARETAVDDLKSITDEIIRDVIYADKTSDWQNATVLKSSDEMAYYDSSTISLATKVSYPCAELEGLTISIDCPSNYKYKILFTKELVGEIQTVSIPFYEGAAYPPLRFISESHKDIIIPKGAGFILALSKADETAINPSSLPSGFKVVIKSVKNGTLSETNKTLAGYAAIDHINLFDKNSAENSIDQYITPSGNLDSAAGYVTSTYIDVRNIEKLYLYRLQIMAFFDADFDILSDTYNPSVVNVHSVDVPDTASYIRVTAYGRGPESAYLSKYDMYPKEHREVISEDLYVFEDRIVDSNGNPALEHLNMFDKDSNRNTANAYITPNGSLSPASDYTTAPYIDVRDIKTLYISNIQIFAFFDANFNILADTFNPSGTLVNTLEVPDTATFFRGTVYGNGINSAYISAYKMGRKSYDEVISKNLYTFQSRVVDDAVIVRSGESMLEGIQYAYSNGIKKVIVEAGTYDIIEEYKNRYGDDYFDTYTTNYNNQINGMFDTGVYLDNIEIIFRPGSKVECFYYDRDDPDWNENVTTYFSPFSVARNVILDGLVLESTNCRYGIHPDFDNNGTESIYFIMRNCDLYHYSDQGESYHNNQAVGAGLGVHSFWLIEDNIFRSEGPTPFVFRVHNHANENSLSKMIIKNNYIVGDGYFVINSYSTSDLMTPVLMSGNSWEHEPVFGKNTPESHINMEEIAWNNELRTN